MVSLELGSFGLREFQGDDVVSSRSKSEYVYVRQSMACEKP